MHAYLLLQVSNLSQDGSGVLDGLDQLITVLQNQDGAMRDPSAGGLKSTPAEEPTSCRAARYL